MPTTDLAKGHKEEIDAAIKQRGKWIHTSW